MKISTKGRYAIKFMLDLATYYQGEPVKVKDSAKRQNVSDKYLEQIVALLNKAGLVKSLRGSCGGYKLVSSPEKYTVGDILKAVEGNLSAVSCISDDGEPCHNKTTCVSVRIWERLDDAINEVLEGITLADLVDWQNEMLADQYVI